MAKVARGSYLGGKKVSIVHVASGTEIRTAAPLDNNGDGSSFSPTDLFAASLGACMMTVMGIVAERRGLDLAGATFEVEKEMGTDPRRITKAAVTLRLPESLGPDERALLERTAMTCPVHHSMADATEKPVTFVYDVRPPA